MKTKRRQRHYRRGIEVHDGTFWRVCFFRHGLSIVNEEYEALETEIKEN